jgi:hypothetical protein
MDIKNPVFDKPIGLGITTTGKSLGELREPKIEIGIRVMLMYQGKQLNAIVTASEGENRFIGRVLGFEDDVRGRADLVYDDLFRFHYDDVRWIG